jgi:PilZ domain
MQPEKRERRSKTASRVELKAKVEICGRDPETPAFEAQSVEVSGRGMQVRTRYLPEVGAPLVLRFEHEGREVIVEGDVAWRREADDGGEFGVKFTALDSKSVVVLKELCGMKPRAEPAPAPASDDAGDPEPPTLSYGAPVKLHIEGLGAPMKARVFEGNQRKLKVGSQLEFLKLGRALELEDLTAGGRRGGRVDTVSVQIDPDSHIPHLVVSIRYEGAEDLTPEPTVVDGARDGAKRASRNDSTRAAQFHADDSDDDEEADSDYDDELDGAEARLKGRFAMFASHAGVSLKRRSEQLARLSHATAASTLAWLQRTRETRRDATPRKSVASSAPKRTTRAAAVSVNAAGGIQRNSSLRRSTPPAKSSGGPREASARSGGVYLPRSAMLALAAAAVVGVGYSVFHDDTPAKFNAEATQFAASTLPAQASGVAFPAPAALNGQALAVNGQPAALAPQPNGIVANVPMFGPTPMATRESAPVNPGPPPGAVDEYSLSKDQVFDDKPIAVPRTAAEETSQSGRPSSSESTAFQVGRMQLPVIYRLRLDAVGTSLQGEKTASGFSVLIPGRKVMENGTSIVRADNRVLDVRVSNTPAGGKVTFRLIKDPPGYKVRLRNDYLEFFINSPTVKSKR